nr:hypothetical protein Iba_chr14bCG7750 [Ipomoea batatas]
MVHGLIRRSCLAGKKQEADDGDVNREDERLVFLFAMRNEKPVKEELKPQPTPATPAATTILLTSCPPPRLPPLRRYACRHQAPLLQPIATTRSGRLRQSPPRRTLTKENAHQVRRQIPTLCHRSEVYSIIFAAAGFRF